MAIFNSYVSVPEGNMVYMCLYNYSYIYIYVVTVVCVW